MNGSVFKREGKRGTVWYGRYWIRDPLTGERAFKSVKAATRKDCEAKLRRAIHDAETGGAAIDRKLTVRDFLIDRWLPAIKPTIRPATYRRYADIATKQIAPALGNVPLVELAPLQIQRLHETHLRAGLSPTTVHHLHMVLHRALHQAMRWGLVSRNVCDMVDPPRRNRTEFQTWDAAQAGGVVTFGDATDLAALWRLALMCGLRRGELLGLKWEDADLERGALAVRRTLSRGEGGRWEIGQPKTSSGRRSIELPASCVAALRKHRAAQNAQRLAIGETWEDNRFIFTNPIGGPLHVNSLMSRFERLIVEAAVPRIRFHDLRHTCATLHLAARTQPKGVQELLGHSNIAMTLDRYSHVSQTMQRSAADSMEQVLGSPQDVAS